MRRPNVPRILIGAAPVLVTILAALLWAPGESRGTSPAAPPPEPLAALPSVCPGSSPEALCDGTTVAQGGPREEVRARVAERIRTMRAWRLTEVLDLDETTAVRLFERLDAYDAANAPLRMELERAGRELRRALEGEDADDARISELTTAIVDGHLAIEALRADLVRSVSDILSPRQVAAFMLFLPEFEREVRELIRDVRREHRRGRDGAHDGSGRGGRGERGERGGRGRRPGRPDRFDRPPRLDREWHDEVEDLGPPEGGPGPEGPPLGAPPGPPPGPGR